MIKCRFEKGDQVLLRHVGVNALIIKDGKVLLGKRGLYNGKPITEHGKWGLIGGYLERDETLVEGMQREIKEETGLSVHDVQLLLIDDNPHQRGEDRQNIDFVYAAKTSSDEASGNEEITEFKWFKLDELPPSREIAFDHERYLNLYRQYLKKPIDLPVIFGQE